MYIGTNQKKALLALGMSLLLVLNAACGNSEQPKVRQESAQQQQTYEREPEKLKNIESRLENLIEILGGPSVKMEESHGGQGGQAGQQSSQHKSTQQGTKQQGTKQQGTQQGTQQQGTKQQEQKQKEDAKWAEIGKIISNLHYQWNEFMPEIAKKGADLKLVDNFDNGLNNLTKTAAGKHSEKTLTAVNDLYSYIPDIYSLFRTKMSPEVKRMIYYTRSIILDGAKGNWIQVKKNDGSLRNSWALFRNTLDKEQKQTGDKLDFAIYELNKVVEAKDKHLADIKGRIVLSNIKELEKSFENKK